MDHYYTKSRHFRRMALQADETDVMSSMGMSYQEINFYFKNNTQKLLKKYDAILTAQDACWAHMSKCITTFSKCPETIFFNLPVCICKIPPSRPKKLKNPHRYLTRGKVVRVLNFDD